MCVRDCGCVCEREPMCARACVRACVPLSPPLGGTLSSEGHSQQRGTTTSSWFVSSRLGSTRRLGARRDTLRWFGSDRTDATRGDALGCLFGCPAIAPTAKGQKNSDGLSPNFISTLSWKAPLSHGNFQKNRCLVFFGFLPDTPVCVCVCARVCACSCACVRVRVRRIWLRTRQRRGLSPTHTHTHIPIHFSSSLIHLSFISNPSCYNQARFCRRAAKFFAVASTQ